MSSTRSLKKFKIILDTNIFLSTFLFGGMSKKIFDQIILGNFELCISEDLIDEINRKLLKLEAEQEAQIQINQILQYKSTVFSPKETIDVCRDPKDDFLLELVIESDADYLITRDKDILTIQGTKVPDVLKKIGTIFIKPEDFVSLMKL